MIERKTCACCGCTFPRNPKLSNKQWDETLYCSKPCFGRRHGDRPTLSKIFARVTIDPITHCWIWGGACDSKGYGLTSYDWQPNQKVHRVVYKLAVGPIPDGILVLHRCDNRPCCNPFHLFLGTVQDNTDDMRLKNRQRYLSGEGAPNARLTADEVAAIRADPRKRAILAAEFGVAQTTISAIKRRVNWKAA